jgi:glycosyltransferase involved in cell wall biosynthesis
MTDKKNQIAIVSQYFYPDHASTGRLMTELGLGLLKKGCDVKVYAGYPTYWGIRQKSKNVENYKGISINRIFLLALDTRTKFGSLCNGVSFFIFTFLKLLFSSEKRMYFFVTTPPFLPFIGYFLKKIKNQKYVVIVHDIHPDIIIKIHYTNEGILIKIWEYINKLVYNNADKIIVLGECMSNVMQQKIPKNREKIKIIQNWEDGDFIKPMLKTQNRFSIENNLLEKFVVIYSGNMGVNHNLEIVIEAANYLKNSEIEFLFFGEGSQKNILIKKSEELHLQNVKFLNFQPLSTLPYTMTCGDAIIVSQETGTEGLCVSSKFYTALAAGKPILAIIGENSEISNVIKKFDCGVVINNYDAKFLAKKIDELFLDKNVCKKYGENARIAFEQNFTYEIAIIKYLEVVKEIENNN